MPENEFFGDREAGAENFFQACKFSITCRKSENNTSLSPF